MISGILSFFGGSIFRMLWGEVSHAFTTWQDHKFELEKLEAQERIDAAQADRNMAMVKLQTEMKLEVVKVEAENRLADLDATNFGKAVDATGRSIGVAWVDAWNGLIRPLAATEVLVLWTLDLYHRGFVMDERSWELAGAVLGVYIADRVLFHKGK